MELTKRASNMVQIRDTAKQLVEKSEDSMPELQAQLIDLTSTWDKVRGCPPPPSLPDFIAVCI